MRGRSNPNWLALWRLRLLRSSRHKPAVISTMPWLGSASRQAEPRLRRVVRTRTGIRPAGYDSPSGEGFALANPGVQVTVTSKIGDSIDRIEGSVARENADWLVLNTKSGMRTIPKRQIVDILQPVQQNKPATDK